MGSTIDVPGEVRATFSGELMALMTRATNRPAGSTTA